ncbi:MAG: ATP:cob(I)alamin adenosyltransferase [Deltaproteobacteria bacterium CG11_big_fil_rev_8_21_14_0_20_42_23]|nr:MAG: ATP:cob(I)alamin adenosyltransferase [Deltaproteobacteria bacterium CG11_big_fil_rev_8_21_14_0_20_42_23]PJC63710.1 MAG: ATP:cob(I)alamin adenosyltransferase [Deltaproteobacteria bacterium CG_4_9_14_0_2_um_filter_42_21]
MSITTKTGDKLSSRFFSGEEASKDALRFEAYGTLDELVAQLGYARSLLADSQFSAEIRELQVDLFRVGGELATPHPEHHAWIQPTNASHVKAMEEKMTAHEKSISLPKSFLIPGATAASAVLDIARTVSRRLERRVVALARSGDYENKHGLIYLNRLSDYLFLLARKVEQEAGVPFDAKER